MFWKSNRIINSQGISLILVSIILVVYRLWVLNSFGLKYFDSDEAIMSLGAFDYSNGSFHTPGFYGQSYNPMFESLLAVPFLWMGLKAYLVLPYITSVLTLLPFLIMTWLLYRRGQYTTALLVIAIPFILPVEYDYITSLSRGWVGGLFVGTLALFSLTGRSTPVKHLWLGFISIVALIIGTGSVFILVPIFLYYAITHLSERKFWIYLSLGAIPALVIVGLFYSFYYEHPNENLHQIKLIISLNNLYRAIGDMPQLFKNVTPMMVHPLIIYFLLPLMASVWFLYKRRYPEGIATIGFLLVFLFSLTMSKVFDGTDSVFYSYSRAFLGLPLVLALLVSRFNIKGAAIYPYLPMVMVAFLAYKAYLFPTTITKDKKSDSVVNVADIEVFLSDSHKLGQLCKEKNVELVVVNNHWFYDHFTYASPSIEENFPPTLRPAYERRTWRLKEEASNVANTILLIDRGRDIANDSTISIAPIPNFEGYFLITNNQTPTLALLKSLKIPIRKF